MNLAKLHINTPIYSHVWSLVSTELCHYCAKDYCARILVHEKNFRDHNSRIAVEWLRD